MCVINQLYTTMTKHLAQTAYKVKRFTLTVVLENQVKMQ